MRSKRIIALMMAFVVIFGDVTPAFAIELPNQGNVIQEGYTLEEGNLDEVDESTGENLGDQEKEPRTGGEEGEDLKEDENPEEGETPKEGETPGKDASEYVLQS